MHGLDSLLFFVWVPMAVGFLGDSLDRRGVRVLLYCLVVPMVVLIGAFIFGLGGGAPGGIASRVGFVYCGTLSILGLSSPRRFFWAFRALTAGIALGLVATALVATVIDAGGPRRDPPSMYWLVAVVIGLPCFLHAMKVRARPSRQRLHVFMSQSCLPTRDRWQRALWQCGFDLAICSDTELSSHTGRLAVTFQGTKSGFLLDVSPTSRLVADRELSEEIAAQWGEDVVSVNFRYDDEREQETALVAAAVLTELTNGRLYVVEHEAWWNGKEAIEAAQDVALPLELHVLFDDERVPKPEDWQNGLKEFGIKLELPAADDLRLLSGFLRATVDGKATGFAFAVSPADFVVGGDRFPASDAVPEVFKMTESANFRFAEGSTEFVAEKAAAVFAEMTGGIVYDPQNSEFITAGET
ncbi:MAG: hypothetical protein HY290_23860 [Planctomycetia bacterium]|nr:hypothetical protein [Planctomycetia bacterium]